MEKIIGYRIKHKGGLYYTGKVGFYNEFGKIYDKKRLKLAWKNSNLRGLTKYHEIEIIEIKVLDVLLNEKL
jgi:hypothetical protein